MAAPPASPAETAARECDALAEDLGWALGAVFRSYAKAASAAIGDVPGGPRGYQVLAAAATDSLGTQLALANRLGVDRTVMTYLLDDLERADLIERRPDPADRRVRRIAVTDQGTRRLADLDERLRHAEDRLLSIFEEPDRAAFRALLRRLAEHVVTHEGPVDACQAAEEAGIAGDRPTMSPRRARRRPA
jgi:DNA-binding MarR family transcriptional regulator